MRQCVLHHQTVCITSSDSVYYIIRQCVLHHQTVCNKILCTRSSDIVY